MNCGHEWKSRAKRPQCPKCKRFRVEVISSEPNNDNDELKEPEEIHEPEPEPVKEEPKPEPDLYVDKAGELILMQDFYANQRLSKALDRFKNKHPECYDVVEMFTNGPASSRNF